MLGQHQVGCKGFPDGSGDPVAIDGIAWVINAGAKGGAIFQCIDLPGVTSAQKMYRGGFIRGGSIKILVGNRYYAVEVANLKPNLIFNTNHLSEAMGALRRVRDFDHESRTSCDRRNEWVVCAQLFFNSFCLKNSLNAKHLLNLVADGGIREVEPGVFPRAS